MARARGRPVLAGQIAVRCSKGPLFTAVWSPLGSLTSIRLGVARFQRCPVRNHWAIVKPVNEADLIEEEERSAHERDALALAWASVPGMTLKVPPRLCLPSPRYD